jgi:signal peptidase I
MEAVSYPYSISADEGTFWSVLTGLLESGRKVRFNPVGTSMRPFIRQGDILTVRPCSPHDLKFGDIVLFATEQKSHRVHRIVGNPRLDGNGFIVTRGDASADTDPPISPEDILGKVSAITKGRFTLDLDQPWGKAVNLTWVLFQRWPVSMSMLRMGWRLIRRGGHVFS